MRALISAVVVIFLMAVFSQIFAAFETTSAEPVQQVLENAKEGFNVLMIGVIAVPTAFFLFLKFTNRSLTA